MTGGGRAAARALGGWLAAGALVLGAPAAAGAQSTSRLRTYLGIIRTPVGALAPLPQAPLADSTRMGLGVHAQFTLLRPSPLAASGRAYGVSVDGPAGRRVRAAASAGWVSTAMPDGGLVSSIMLGAAARAELLERPMGGEAGARRAQRGGLGLELGAGASRGNGLTAVAGSVGLPLSIAFRVRGRATFAERDSLYRPRTVFFVTPAMAFGSLDAGELASHGWLPTVTTGFSVLAPGPRLGVVAAARYVLLPDNKVFLALGASWYPR